MSPIRVLLVDDHTLVRAGIRSLLNSMPQVLVVGEANNGRQAVQMAEQHGPQVVLMDIAMPEMNGLDATAQLTASQPSARVVILSMNATEEYVVHALQAGAVGYVTKDISPHDLQQAIETAFEGNVYLSPAISKLVASGIKNRQKLSENHADRLSIRQREVLQLLAEGLTTKQIAAKLGVSSKTVETHRMQVMNTLDIHNIAGLVRYAIRHGIISQDS